jgi:hypothetical protein
VKLLSSIGVFGTLGALMLACAGRSESRRTGDGGESGSSTHVSGGGDPGAGGSTAGAAGTTDSGSGRGGASSAGQAGDAFGGSGEAGGTGGCPEMLCGTECGDNRCAADEYCCSPLCGTCAPVGHGCESSCAPPRGERCGREYCPENEICCDVNCGVCAVSIPYCPDLDECPPVCSAMTAQAEGVCLAIIGFAWNGTACEQLAGCRCAGEDCDVLFESADACRASHADCPTE